MTSTKKTRRPFILPFLLALLLPAASYAWRR